MLNVKVAGKSAFDLVPLDLARKSQDKDQQVLTNQTTQIYEAQIANAQGAVRDVVFHKAPFTDDAGILCGLIGTFLDITDRKKREEEIRYLSVHDPQTGLLNRNAIRMLQLEEDKAAVGEDLKEVYAEAKGVGFDTKIIRQLIRLRKQEVEKRRETEELLELYKAAIGMEE